MKKQYKLGTDSRVAIKRVAKDVGDILGKTLGPAGRNYFLPVGITNDGKTILEHIRFANECEDQAALAFHEIARAQDKEVGDGTTTACVVGSELYLSNVDSVADIDTPVYGASSVIDLMEKIDKEKEKAIELLKTKVEKVDTLEALERVAFTSVENEETAKIVAKAMWDAGKDSFPILDEGFNEKVETDVLKGVKYPVVSPYPNMQGQYDNVMVLVVNHTFEEYAELSPLMVSLMQTKPTSGTLLLVGKQFSVPFIQKISETNRAHADMAAMKGQTGFKIILAAHPKIHQDTFEDLASYVDARCVDTHPKTGNKITDLIASDLGYAKKVIIGEKDTAFIGGRGEEALILTHEGSITRLGKRVEELKKQLETEKDATERTSIEKRIAGLLGGIATIYVDAKTAAERYYVKLKVEDAMNSCRAAMNGGMVKGGGVSLKEIAEELGTSSVLYKALKKPYDRIIANNLGQAVHTEGVYDAFEVARAGIENAVSVVKTLLTIEGIIADTDTSAITSLKELLA